MSPNPRSALFVLPLSGAEASGPIAPWLLAVGWAEAAERRLGFARLVTPQGALTAVEARFLASRPSLAAGSMRDRSKLETIFRTAAKDLLAPLRARRFSALVHEISSPPSETVVVWQYHQAFHDAGFHLARRYRCPCVLHVDAPIVWEARRWGIQRPGWGRLVEQFGELPQMKSADLLTCPSEEVREELLARRIPAERILVTPGGVDLGRFNAAVSGEGTRRRLGLSSMFVVGWSGSFRRFHGVETALKAFAGLQEKRPETALLLVGDGFQKPELQRLAMALGLRNVIFTGTVAHENMPQYIAAMDVALVLAPVDQGFHYSPMKLREYMATGRPVIAARVGEIERVLTDGRDALLVPPNDSHSLVEALIAVHDDRHLRSELGRAAQVRMEEGSWDHQLGRVLEALR